MISQLKENSTQRAPSNAGSRLSAPSSGNRHERFDRCGNPPLSGPSNSTSEAWGGKGHAEREIVFSVKNGPFFDIL
jgi:hypothetical protein